MTPEDGCGEAVDPVFLNTEPEQPWAADEALAADCQAATNQRRQPIAEAGDPDPSKQPGVEIPQPPTPESPPQPESAPQPQLTRTVPVPLSDSVKVYDAIPLPPASNVDVPAAESTETRITDPSEKTPSEHECHETTEHPTEPEAPTEPEVAAEAKPEPESEHKPDSAPEHKAEHESEQQAEALHEGPGLIFLYNTHTFEAGKTVGQIIRREECDIAAIEAPGFKNKADHKLYEEELTLVFSAEGAAARKVFPKGKVSMLTKVLTYGEDSVSGAFQELLESDTSVTCLDITRDTPGYDSDEETVWYKQMHGAIDRGATNSQLRTMVKHDLTRVAKQILYVKI
jgi:hypothetical protein